MCNPMLAIGTGLSLAGGLARGATNRANTAAYQRVEREAYLRSKKAREDEIKRQQTFEADANAGWQQATQALGKDKYDQTQQAAVQQFLDTVDSRPSAAVPEGFLLSGQDTATDEVTTEIANRAAKAAQEARARITALAKLTSFDTAALDRSLSLGRNADKLSTVNNMRRGSLGVSQDEQSIAAGQVIPGDNMLADILSGAGGSLSGASWRY